MKNAFLLRWLDKRLTELMDSGRRVEYEKEKKPSKKPITSMRCVRSSIIKLVIGFLFNTEQQE